MTECHCERCSATPKNSYTNTWRVETLARELMCWTPDEERTYLEKMDQRARPELEAELMRLRLAQKAAA